MLPSIVWFDTSRLNSSPASWKKCLKVLRSVVVSWSLGQSYLMVSRSVMSHGHLPQGQSSVGQFSSQGHSLSSVNVILYSQFVRLLGCHTRPL